MKINVDRNHKNIDAVKIFRHIVHVFVSRKRCMMTTVALINLVACMSVPSPNMVEKDRSTASANVSVLPSDVSTPIPVRLAYFPQRSADKEIGIPDVGLTSTLILVDKCLRVGSANQPKESLLVIWPPGVTLRTLEDVVEILDSDGQVVAQVGQSIFLGGGKYKEAAELPDWIRQQLPAECAGPYWLAGDRISLQPPQ